MPRITLESEHLRAEIDPDLGGSLTGLWIKGPLNSYYPLLRTAPASTDLDNNNAMQSACYFLAPWSNRINAGKFTFDGHEYAVRPNFEDGHAIHGDIWTRAFDITDRTPISARLKFDSRQLDAHAQGSDGSAPRNFPFDFGVVLRVELHPSAIDLQLSVTNLDHSPMPAGLGFHPFFNRTIFSTDDRPTIHAPVSGRYPARACIPTGPAQPDDITRRLSQGGEEVTDLDDCFAGFKSPATIQYPASGLTVSIESSETLDHLVVFTPTTDKGAIPWFCVEPVSIATDGFNLEARGIDAGMAVLEPNQTLDASMTIRIDQSPSDQ